MSYYDDSSLFVAPNGYKTSVLFAQKPMDANGQLAFTRSNDTATRVGPDGLIDKVRTNLLLYSEQFDNAAWAKTGCTVTANSSTDPIGGTTADTLTGNGILGAHEAAQTFSFVSGTTYTLSVYLKKNTNNFIQLIVGSAAFGSNVWANFNLDTGAVGSVGSSTTASIVNAGNGWYRCAITGTASATAAAPASIFLVNSATSTRGETSSLVTSVFLWGAMLELSDFGPTAYIPTTTAVSVGPVANLPRIDYTGGGCGKLLLEPQRTNLALYSESFDNAAWNKTNVTIAANDEVSPDGYTNADKITDNANSTQHRVTQAISVTSGTSYTASIFVKNDDKGDFAINFTASGFASTQIVFNLINGTVTSGTGTIQDYGNGWYRISATAAANVTGSGTIGFNLGNGGSYVGSSQSVFIYGAQIEAGAYATSYIGPTLGSASTRGADACSKTGISSLIGQTEGTLFVEVDTAVLGDVFSGNSRRFLTISDGTTTNRVIIFQSFIDDSIQFLITTSGVANVSFTTSANQSGIKKTAIAYANNDFAAFMNGVLVGSSASGSVPACSRVGVGSFETSANTANAACPVSQALLFKTRLSNSELASLTTL